MSHHFDAVVLAAGFGTRLAPITHHVPKALVPVCGVPALAYALAHCAAHGLHRVAVNAHHLADQMLPWSGSHEGVDVEVFVESPHILGTGGPLVRLRDRLADPFVVLNADVLNNIDLVQLRDATPHDGAAMALRPYPDSDLPYGIVAADSANRVVELAHYATAPSVGTALRDTHFTGVHAMRVQPLLGLSSGPSSVMHQVYQRLVPERRVAAIRHEGAWWDTGNPRAYLLTNLAVLCGRADLALDPRPRAAWGRFDDTLHGPAPEGVVLRGSVWSGQRTSLATGTVLEDTVLGDGATVSNATTLTRCVVMPDAEVPAGNHTETLFYAGGHVDTRGLAHAGKTQHTGSR